jgi:membrane protein required for colicin V production
MNWADWLIVTVVAISTLLSLKRGFVREALSLAIWLAAIFIALVFNGEMQLLLQDVIEVASVRKVAAFAALFLAVLVTGALLNYLMSTLVKATGLTGTDRILGLVFGFVRGVLVVLVILMVLPAIVPIEQDLWYRQSRLVPKVMLLESWFVETASQVWTLVTQAHRSGAGP